MTRVLILVLSCVVFASALEPNEYIAEQAKKYIGSTKWSQLNPMAGKFKSSLFVAEILSELTFPVPSRVPGEAKISNWDPSKKTPPPSPRLWADTRTHGFEKTWCPVPKGEAPKVGDIAAFGRDLAVVSAPGKVIYPDMMMESVVLETEIAQLPASDRIAYRRFCGDISQDKLAEAFNKPVNVGVTKDIKKADRKFRPRKPRIPAPADIHNDL